MSSKDWVQTHLELLVELEVASCEFALDHSKGEQLAQARAKVLQHTLEMVKFRQESAEKLETLIKGNLRKQRALDTRLSNGIMDSKAHKKASISLSKEVDTYLSSVFK